MSNKHDKSVEEKDKKQEAVEGQVAEENQQTGEINEEMEGLEKALADAELKATSAEEKYLRLYAEFENFRRRTAKERLEMMEMAGTDLVSDLLPILDDFERAMKSNEHIEDPAALKEGFSLIYEKLLRTLKSRGLEEMTSKGEPFDDEKHEAISRMPAPDESQKGHVVEEAEKGYYYKGKIIRYAKVVVGQ